MKACSKCKVKKPLSDFYANKSQGNLDGLSSWCKDCHKADCRRRVLQNPHVYKPIQERGIKAERKREDEFQAKYGLSTATIRRYGFRNAITAYDRANRQCEECGEKYDLTLHHKDGKGINQIIAKKPANNDPKNLVVLCRRCHGRIHSHLFWKK